MTEKILTLRVYEEGDGYSTTSQEIYDKEHDISFSVYNLCECPEDAIIGRDLFNANDYIKALNKGISIAHKGITKVTGIPERNQEKL